MDDSYSDDSAIRLAHYREVKMIERSHYSPPRGLTRQQALEQGRCNTCECTNPDCIFPLQYAIGWLLTCLCNGKPHHRPRGT